MTCFRGGTFSPSLLRDGYLNLCFKSDHKTEISGNIVRYDTPAPRAEELRSFSPFFYANMVLRVLDKINSFANLKISYTSPLE